jgi:hypothetical protein
MRTRQSTGNRAASRSNSAVLRNPPGGSRRKTGPAMYAI